MKRRTLALTFFAILNIVLIAFAVILEAIWKPEHTLLPFIIFIAIIAVWCSLVAITATKLDKKEGKR